MMRDEMSLLKVRKGNIIVFTQSATQNDGNEYWQFKKLSQEPMEQSRRIKKFIFIILKATLLCFGLTKDTVSK